MKANKSKVKITDYSVSYIHIHVHTVSINQEQNIMKILVTSLIKASMLSFTKVEQWNNLWALRIFVVI